MLKAMLPCPSKTVNEIRPVYASLCVPCMKVAPQRVSVCAKKRQFYWSAYIYALLSMICNKSNNKCFKTGSIICILHC